MYSIILAYTVADSTAGHVMKTTTLTVTMMMTLANKMKPFYSHPAGMSGLVGDR